MCGPITYSFTVTPTSLGVDDGTLFSTSSSGSISIIVSPNKVSQFGTYTVTTTARLANYASVTGVKTLQVSITGCVVSGVTIKTSGAALSAYAWEISSSTQF